MKTHIEDFLHTIDLALKDKPAKEINMIYIMVFSAIFAFSYLLFWDSSVEEFLNKIKHISSLTHKITSDKVYLKVNPPMKILKLNKEIKKYNDKILNLKDNNDYIKHQIETIPSLIYDKKIWGEYLYSISKNAKIHNVKILDFSNSLAQNRTSFGHILDISLKSTATFIDTLKFIDSLERSDLVVDVHHISMTSEDTLYTDLKISVWGITY